MRVIQWRIAPKFLHRVHPGKYKLNSTRTECHACQAKFNHSQGVGARTQYYYFLVAFWGARLLQIFAAVEFVGVETRRFGLRRCEALQATRSATRDVFNQGPSAVTGGALTFRWRRDQKIRYCSPWMLDSRLSLFDLVCRILLVCVAISSTFANCLHSSGLAF